MGMNINAGKIDAVEGLVSQVMLPANGPKDAKGRSQYTFVLASPTFFVGESARPGEKDYSVRILEGGIAESIFAKSLLETTDSLDAEALEGKYVRIAYVPQTDKPQFSNTVLEAVQKTPFR